MENSMRKCVISDNASQGILRTITHNQCVKLYYQGKFTKLAEEPPIKKNHKRRKINDCL